MLVAATQLYDRGVLIRDRDAGPARLAVDPAAPDPVAPVERAVAAAAAPGIDGPRLVPTVAARPELRDLRHRLQAAGLVRPAAERARRRRRAGALAWLAAAGLVLASVLVWPSPWAAVTLAAVAVGTASAAVLARRATGPRTPAGDRLLVAAAAAWAEDHTGAQRVAIVGPGVTASAAPGLAAAVGLLPGRQRWPTPQEIVTRTIRSGQSQRMPRSRDAEVAYRDYG